jgi:hypothetical protein|tara:strand:+ start:4709 stop:5092 length:384 start_codon:yes stop_codon:yes gene_type:complete
MNQKLAQIQRIKDRYYRKVIAGSMVTHHGDCKIYAADYPHCSCGLIHDLMPLHFSGRIFPRFGEDRAVSDGVGTIFPKPTKADLEASRKTFDDLLKRGVFKEATTHSPEINQSIVDEEEAIKQLLEL